MHLKSLTEERVYFSVEVGDFCCTLEFLLLELNFIFGPMSAILQSKEISSMFTYPFRFGH